MGLVILEINIGIFKTMLALSILIWTDLTLPLSAMYNVMLMIVLTDCF